MGKSPARWLKHVLLGKKSSKSTASKGRERAPNEKDLLVTAKVAESVVDLEASAAPDINSNAANRSINLQEMKDMDASKISNDGDIISGIEKAEAERSDVLSGLSDSEKIQHEKAATVVQAAFRGYLARRAFWALKGIIRLQALIRGHLVRRQAVATLHCAMGIIKLQALARGKLVRRSGVGAEVAKRCSLQSALENKAGGPDAPNTYLGIKNISTNAFISKLLATSPTVMALQLNYESNNLNSVPSWLERWSASCFWKTTKRPKKVLDAHSQKKLGNGQHGEPEIPRQKRSVRKVPAANLDNSSEIERPKRNLRKAPYHTVEPVQDNPQIELEKVKRNLRKVHNPVVENSIQPQTETEKPRPISEKMPVPSHTIEQPGNLQDKETKNEIEVKLAVQSELSNPPAIVEAMEVSCPPEAEQVLVEPKRFVMTETKDENTPVVNGDVKDATAGKENQKSARKSWAGTKTDRLENGILNNSPKLPSYMQATESAKAKLRLQGSPRSPQESADKNITRRHSLPSANNTRVTSHSPRTHRATNSGGKSANKNEKSLLSSRDGNVKGVQAEWRR